jgi:gas vesicle protein
MARQRSGQSGQQARSTGRESASEAGTGMPGGGADVGASASASDQGGQSVASQVKDKAQQLADEAQQQATERARSGLDHGKARAAETLGSVAQSLRQSTQQLRDQNQQPASRILERVADRAERVSNYLRDTDVDQLIDRAEDVARRKPGLFLGGAFALGLLGARFLKNSSRNQSRRWPDRELQRGVIPRADMSASADRSRDAGSGYARGYAGGYAGEQAGGYPSRTATERDVTGLRDVASESRARPAGESATDNLGELAARPQWPDNTNDR